MKALEFEFHYYELLQTVQELQQPLEDQFRVEGPADGVAAKVARHLATENLKDVLEMFDNCDGSDQSLLTLLDFSLEEPGWIQKIRGLQSTHAFNLSFRL